MCNNVSRRAVSDMSYYAIARGYRLLEQDGLSSKMYFPLSAALDEPLLRTSEFTSHTQTRHVEST